MSSQHALRHGCGIPSPGPAARRNRRAGERHSRSPETDPIRRHSRLRSRLSGLRGRRAGQRRDAQRSAVEAGWLVSSNSSTTRSTAPSRTRQERSRTSDAVTRPRPNASSRTSGGCAHCAARAHGSTPISRCAAPTSASTSATLPAPSNSPRSRTMHSRDIPMPERFRPVAASRSADQARTGLRTHTCRAPARRFPADASLPPGHRRSSSPGTPYRQDTRVVDLRQARRHKPSRRCRGH